MPRVNPIDQDIISDLQSAFNQEPSGSHTRFGSKAPIWSRPAVQFRKEFSRGPLVDRIRELHLSGELVFTFPTHSVQGNLIIEQQIEYLQTLQLDVENMSPDICESTITDPRLLFNIQDRPLSTEFLSRLIISQRVSDALNLEDISVLEIGAGMGGFARIAKLRNPSIRYVIIDLLDTISLSYTFLRLNFPDARVILVHNKTELSALDLSVDFIFIPAHLVEDIEPMHFDLVVNSFSLGEMPQPVVDSYMDLIQETLDVDRFYSLNRYLQHEKFADWLDESDQASYSTPVDSHWDLLLWNFCPPFVQRHLVSGGSKWIQPQYKGEGWELDSTATLELYLKRKHKEQDDPNELRVRSDDLLREALELNTVRGPKWHRLMWESIMLSPRLENLEPYYSCLKSNDLREHRYFGRLITRLGGAPSEPPHRSRRIQARYLRSMAGRAVRRVFKPVMRFLDS